VTFAEAPTGNSESDKTKRESVFLGMKHGVFEKGQSCRIMETADMAMLGNLAKQRFGTRFYTGAFFGSMPYSVHNRL